MEKKQSCDGCIILFKKDKKIDPDICQESRRKNKPVVFYFYNSQRCGVNIVNKILEEYNSQPIIYSWILDLAAARAQTVLKYNSEIYQTQPRKNFLTKLAIHLCIRYIHDRLKTQSLQQPVQQANSSILGSFLEFRDDTH